jgi:hypothetical protein
MKHRIRRLMTLLLVIALAGAVASCEPPKVYGSVGYSSYGGGYGGYGGGVRVGGRIY